jgi:hypothetical protein
VVYETDWWPLLHGASFILAGQAVTVDVGKVKTQPRWHQPLGEPQAGEAQGWAGSEPGEQLMGKGTWQLLGLTWVKQGVSPSFPNGNMVLGQPQCTGRRLEPFQPDVRLGYKGSWDLSSA